MHENQSKKEEERKKKRKNSALCCVRAIHTFVAFSTVQIYIFINSPYPREMNQYLLATCINETNTISIVSSRIYRSTTHFHSV